jgi:alpha-D-ribose 1-methylphosphonate 5-triphosphate synthase subunit PhnH
MRHSPPPVVADWLRFHTGAPIVESEVDAMFAFVADPLSLPALDRFAPGTDEYPDRSTTLIIAVESLGEGPPLTLRGPGIRDAATLAPMPLIGDFAAQWAGNRSRFPRGVDVVFAAAGEVAGLPRSSRIVEG